MALGDKKQPRRVLIVSSHPLFGQGLRGLLEKRQPADVTVVGIVSSVDEAIAAFDTLQPDLAIVDYDDERVNRDEFLARFVEGAMRLRVVLLSLKEGGSEAIVYDRRTTEASQIDDWLKEWTSPKAGRRANLRRPRYSLRSTNAYEQITDRRRGNMKHFLFAGLVVLALAALMLFGLSQVRLLPLAASTQAGPIDWLFNVHFILIAVLFSLIVGLMLYTIVVFRRRGNDTTDGDHIEGNTKLEVFWTLVPLAVVIYISFLGAQILGQIQEREPGALVVDVIGSQWSWRFEYPEEGIVSTELVLPVDRQVLLRLSSQDVIHSFWVPEFRIKQDMLPGGEAMVREVRITPSEEGEYKVRCAEMCGRLHYSMEAPVRVMSAEAYADWVSGQVESVSDDPVVRGEQLSQQYGCVACHSTDGTTLVGPTWKGLFGSQKPLADGTTITVDEAYLYESIREPGAKLVAGFADIMPHNIADGMTDEQVYDVIEFIKSLQ